MQVRTRDAIEDKQSPITKGLPEVWQRSDEWYAFTENPRNKSGFHILATVDEKSYEPGKASMGADHPLMWWHCVGKGHALYSALGHSAEFYSEPHILFHDGSSRGHAVQLLTARAQVRCAIRPVQFQRDQVVHLAADALLWLTGVLNVDFVFDRGGSVESA